MEEQKKEKKKKETKEQTERRHGQLSHQDKWGAIPNLSQHVPSLGRNKWTWNKIRHHVVPGLGAHSIDTGRFHGWFGTMADNLCKLVSQGTETRGSLLNPGRSCSSPCRVSESCSALQPCAKETWKLGLSSSSCLGHSYGISALLIFFFISSRIMCVISNMCWAMCSLFTNYLISPVCSLRYRQCSISLFPAFQNEWV